MMGMKSTDVFQHFGTQAAAAAALGMAQSGVASWGEYPPEARQLLIERVTLGALKAEPGCFERLIGLDNVPQAASA